MGDFERFIIDNSESDIARLLFSCKNWPQPDDPVFDGLDLKELATSTIEARKKLRKKVPEWYSLTSLVYPRALSAEQCSSSATAFYKASVVRDIIGRDGRVADLTGGLGVDSWAFSREVAMVVYNDKDSLLAKAATHNFRELGSGNIAITSVEVGPSSLGPILDGFSPDIVYIDPARRSLDGRKVFLLEECSPDVLQLLPEIFRSCRHLLLKLSPMADIRMVVERLNRSYEAFLEKTRWEGWNGRWIREVHVVSSGGECKELLVWMDREWNDSFSITCVEDSERLTFPAEEIAAAKPVFPDSAYSRIIFEPGKSLSKAGVFNVLCQRFGLVKFARSTHLYTFAGNMSKEELSLKVEALRSFGKFFEVAEVLPFSKSSLKEIGKRFPHSEVSAKNIPLSSDELRTKLGVSSGDDAHIFGARLELPFESGNFLFVCHKM